MPEDKKRWTMYKKAIIDTPPTGYDTGWVKHIWDYKWNTPEGRDRNATVWVDTLAGVKLTIPEGWYWAEDGLVTDGEHPLVLEGINRAICIVTTEGTGGLYRQTWISPQYDVRGTVAEDSLTYKTTNYTSKTVSVPRNTVHTYWFTRDAWNPKVHYGDKTGAISEIALTGTTGSSTQGSKTTYICTDGSTFYKGKIQQIRAYVSFPTKVMSADSKVDRERFNLY